MDYTYTGDWPAIVEIPLDHANPWVFSGYQAPISDAAAAPGTQTRAESPEIYHFDEDVFERDYYTVKPPPEPTKKRTGKDASGRGGADTAVPNRQMLNITKDPEDVPGKVEKARRHYRYTISAVEVIIAHLSNSNSYEILPECLIEATPEPANSITPQPTLHRGSRELGAAAAATLLEVERRSPGKPKRSDTLRRSCLGTPSDREDDGPRLRRGRNQGKRVTVASAQPAQGLEIFPIALLGTSRAPIIIDDDPPPIPPVAGRNSLARPIRERARRSPSAGKKPTHRRELVRYGRERILGQIRVAGKPGRKISEQRGPGMNPWGICKKVKS